MNLHKHFLPQDLERASKHYHCLIDCLGCVTDSLQKGNVELAKQRSIDVTRSLHELCLLAEKKYEIDRMNFYIEMMGVSGINMQVIRRMHNG